MSEQRSITLLHLSDPQFGPKHRFDGTAPGSLFARLRADFEDMRERHGLVPDLVLVTGDLVETGKPSEFKQFKAFAEATVEHFGLSRRRLVMIPGNHDINRAAAEAYFKECESDERSPKLPYWPKLRHYAAMFAEFYASEPDITFTESAPYSLFEYPELGVIVAALNSTLAESHRPEDHYGFLGESQLRHFAGKLRLAADQGLLRIGAVHHHPIHPEGDGAKQDLRDLKRFLGPYLNLVVHGHIHEDELNWLDNTTPILGVGSAGVKAPQRPEEVPNQYQWIRVTADSLEYGSRAYVPDQKRWVGDLRPDRDGERWWQRKSVAFERVATLSTRVAPEVSAGSRLAQAVASHRAALSRQLRERPLLVDLATYGEDGDLGHRLELLTIFIPQRTMQEVPRSDRPGELRELRRREREEVEFVAETAGPPGLIDEIVTSEAHPWTLVLGTPGAGKTTLTMWLALKLCAEGEGLPGLSSDLVPVRIELRLFVERWSGARAQGRGYDFFDYLDDLHREESRALRADTLHELAAASRLLWLFDGLDEVANKEHRAAITSMIIGVRETHGGRGVITGRIVGCRPLQSRFHAADIHCFTLLDLSDEQVDEFIRRWHVLAFPQARDLGERRQERLQQALAANSTVRDLCRNPLLLTLVALLNRGDELPRRRHKLLERASELMLSQWETNKELPAGHAVQFDPADKRRYLAELAWHMLTELSEGPGNVIEVEALERFTVAFCERRFQASSQTAAANARALIQHLRERNYVLGLLGGSQFGFLHKAFFEYFAAEEAVHHFRSQQWRIGDLKRLFTERWQDDAWTEILILICGLLQEDRSEPVIAVLQTVLASPPLTKRIDLRTSLLFAVRCLAEVRRLESGPALALALALNRHIRAVLQFVELLVDPWFLAEERRAREDKLSEAFHTVAGGWPGVEQELAELADADSYKSSHGSTLQSFLAALEGDTRVSWYLRLIEGHKIAFYSLDNAAANGLWGQDDNQRLWRLLRQQASLSPTVILAVARLLVRTRPTDVPAAELLDSAPPVMQAQLRALLSRMRSATAHQLKNQPGLFAALAMSGLPLVPAEHRVELFLWLLSQRNHEPTAQELEHMKAALGMDLARADVAFHLAFAGHDEVSLRKALAAYTSDPRRAINRLQFSFRQWPRAFDITLEWLRHLSDRDESRQLSGLLEALWQPGQDVALTEVEQAVRLSVRADGTPDWFLLHEAGSFVHRLETEEVLHCVDMALAVHTQQPLAVGLSILSAKIEYDVEEWAHNDPLLPRFKELIETAITQQPWLALAYFHHLPDDDVAKLKARLSTPGFAARLRASSLAGSQDYELNAASCLAKEIPGLPWELPLRHLLAHGTDTRLRIDTALELGDWAWLQHAADTGSDELKAAAQAALDVAESLAGVLRAGRLRRAEVRRGGVRVGQLLELEGATRFVYDREYLAQANARPIAPNMPLRPEPFDSPGLHPVFEGLLPQGWLLDIDLKKYRLKSGDQFGLLLATGRHTIGAIEIIPEDEAP